MQFSAFLSLHLFCLSMYIPCYSPMSVLSWLPRLFIVMSRAFPSPHLGMPFHNQPLPRPSLCRWRSEVVARRLPTPTCSKWILKLCLGQMSCAPLELDP